MDPVTLGMAKASAAKAVAPVASDAWRALGALSGRIPVRAPAATTAPVITWQTGIPTATPTYRPAFDYGAAYAPTSNYTLSGGNYVQAGPNSPDRDALFTDIIPGNNAVNYGNADVDFYSDAPSITFRHYRTQGGTIRVLADGVEMLRVGNSMRNATAQAATSTTITLDTGASAVNGFYATRYVMVTTGTGAGQVRQITGYVGATKVATVHAPWTTVPDATSVFSVSGSVHTFHNAYNTSNTLAYLNFDWSGERRMRHYRVETNGANFFGVYTAATDQVIAAPKNTGPRCVWIGDSFSEGTGAEAKEGMAWVASRALGWELWNLSVGGTGYLNPAPALAHNGSMPFGLRVAPPVNAWRWTRRTGAGSLTVTQGGVSATFLQSDTANTIQAAMDAAFGANKWNVYGGNPTAFTVGVWFIGVGTNADNAAPLTIDATFAAAYPQSVLVRWAGDLAPCVPYDGSGNALPFVVVLAGGHNDTTGTNASYTAPVLQAAVAGIITKIQTAYPTAVVIVLGIMYLPGATAVSIAGAWDTAIKNAVTATAKRVNGQVPFLPLITLFTGSGYLGSLQGNGTSDFATHTDGVHPSPIGHHVYGTKIASQINALLGRS